MYELQKHLVALSDVSRRLSDAYGPMLTGMAQLHERIGLSAFAQTKMRLPLFASDQWLEATRAIGRVAEQYAEAFAPLADTLRPIIEEAKRCARVDAAGWLPHATTPFAKFESEDLGPEEVAAIIDAHYRDAWETVKERLLAEIDECDVDEVARTNFERALWAHEQGHYSFVVRGLMPEIERVSRIEFMDNPMDKMASQPQLREAVLRLCPRDFGPGGIGAYVVFRHVQKHVYEVVNTQAKLDATRPKPVPNRHVAPHGHGTYDTHQSSINMLILTLFMFRAVSILKRRKQALEDGVGVPKSDSEPAVPAVQ